MNLSFMCNNYKKISKGNLHIEQVTTAWDYTNLYVTQGGKPIIPVMGELHFSRYPHELWEEEILKMKAAGITIISTYMFWIHHEETEGCFDFTGDKDIKKFLYLCEKHHMLVLLRIGPWCHGEVVYGGFPAFIQEREDKRTSSKGFLQKVENLYSAYYEQVKSFFYQDGSILLGIQLDNEYGGNDPQYIKSLYNLALSIGFKLPLYTITAWPPNSKLKGDLLPLFGSYPERPWTQHTKPLPVDNRFKITLDKIDKGIGSDILKNAKWEDLPYDAFPYATCELGCGIQVCEHRRPIISSNDAYAIIFIHLAQGVNWPGYYMFHGGRNPLGGEYQESKRTGYPNDCSVLTYDFQAPISEYGYLRESYHYLKLLHYFLNDFGSEFATMQPFMCEQTNTEIDYKTTLRINEKGEGFLFFNNYQRTVPYAQINCNSISWENTKGKWHIPGLKVPTDKSIFFPVNYKLGNLCFRYLLAQPICKHTNKKKEQYFFFVPDGIDCRFEIESEGTLQTQAQLDANGIYHLTNHHMLSPAITTMNHDTQVEVFILSQEKALQIWKVNDRILFTKDTVLPEENQITLLHQSGTATQVLQVWEDPIQENSSFHLIDKQYPDYMPTINLTEKEVEPRAYDSYFYDLGKKAEYTLHVPQDLFTHCKDCLLEFKMEGNLAQIFAGEEMIADWLNFDGTWVVGLERFKPWIEKGMPLHIKTSPIDAQRDIYFETEIPRNSTLLQLEKVIPIYKEIL